MLLVHCILLLLLLRRLLELYSQHRPNRHDPLHRPVPADPVYSLSIPQRRQRATSALALARPVMRRRATARHSSRTPAAATAAAAAAAAATAAAATPGNCMGGSCAGSSCRHT